MADKHDSGDVQQFSLRSSSYESSWTQPLFFDRVHRLVLSLMGSEAKKIEDGTVLDVGCGTGRLLRKVGACWPATHLIGVDPAQGMVDVARRLTPAATIQLGVAESLPLPDDSVDLALSTFSYHHWRDQAAGVRDVARVLRRGRCFVLADVFVPAPLPRIVPHFGRNTTAGVSASFNQAGLQIEMRRQTMLLVRGVVGRKS